MGISVRTQQDRHGAEEPTGRAQVHTFHLRERELAGAASPRHLLLPARLLHMTLATLLSSVPPPSPPFILNHSLCQGLTAEY